VAQPRMAIEACPAKLEERRRAGPTIGKATDRESYIVRENITSHALSFGTHVRDL
jgi:hypothetical protein